MDHLESPPRRQDGGSSDDRPVIVTMSGRPGSGKSTVAKALASLLGLRHVSAGDFMREMAAERGVSVLEFSTIAENDDTVDLEIDARTRRLGESGESFVMDSRLAWHFIPHSVKVFLDVRADVAARRIYSEVRTTESENVDLDTTVRNIERRARSESTRFRQYYGVDYLDPSHYDLVVDTSDCTVDAVIETIEEFLVEPDRA